ncbi:hypothetical protein L209DRAFT_377745 [Thermothelomyces heterothallicus CBS 203.75]
MFKDFQLRFIQSLCSKLACKVPRLAVEETETPRRPMMDSEGFRLALFCQIRVRRTRTMAITNNVLQHIQEEKKKRKKQKATGQDSSQVIYITTRPTPSPQTRHIKAPDQNEHQHAFSFSFFSLRQHRALGPHHGRLRHDNDSRPHAPAYRGGPAQGEPGQVRRKQHCCGRCAKRGQARPCPRCQDQQ